MTTPKNEDGTPVSQRQWLMLIAERDHLNNALEKQTVALVNALAKRDALAAQNEILQNDCFNLTEKVIPNLREQRDALADEVRDLDIELTRARSERNALRALLNRVWSGTDLHEWNDEKASLLCDEIDAALAAGEKK